MINNKNKKGSEKTLSQERAKIYYLHHSGFAVKIRGNLLVFDYYSHEPEGRLSGLDKGTISHKDLEEAETVYVFVSHSHHDHYNPVIFEWERINSNIQYFLSFDVETPSKDTKYCSMQPYEEYKDDSIFVKAYGSTDIGVSFKVEIGGFKIFHAGDLNCWYWYYESTPQELEEDENKFLVELEMMKDEDVDIAFFPVDPRLEEYYYMGGEYFIKKLKPRLFIPMHFWDDYSITRTFAQRLAHQPTKIVELSHRGQEIIFKK
ncbi:MAG: MBL fold metallo-hydrolase [Clostridiales bacterium]|nr:MBL fold metallo-hydrolase [Clostridiales bacterium]